MKKWIYSFIMMITMLGFAVPFNANAEKLDKVKENKNNKHENIVKNEISSIEDPLVVPVSLTETEKEKMYELGFTNEELMSMNEDEYEA